MVARHSSRTAWCLIRRSAIFTSLTSASSAVTAASFSISAEYRSIARAFTASSPCRKASAWSTSPNARFRIDTSDAGVTSEVGTLDLIPGATGAAGSAMPLASSTVAGSRRSGWLRSSVGCKMVTPLRVLKFCGLECRYIKLFSKEFVVGFRIVVERFEDQFDHGQVVTDNFAIIAAERIFRFQISPNLERAVIAVELRRFD